MGVEISMEIFFLLLILQVGRAGVEGVSNLNICGEVAGDVLAAGGGVGKGGVGQGLTVRPQGLAVRAAEPVNVGLSPDQHISYHSPPPPSTSSTLLR